VTERRRFSGSEHVALYLAAGGQCAECGADLEPGWHADHVDPYSRSRNTDVVNGQALCPTCNLKKGSKVTRLRPWQDAALAQLVRTNGDFLAVACPGAGKTMFALVAAQKLIELGAARRIIVVVPTDHLRRQWADAASGFGIQLDYKFVNRATVLARDYDGMVVTYAAVASEPALYRKLASEHALVILDEVHHGGDEKAWGNALRTAFEVASRRLLLSGTPTRTDRAPVPFIHYDERGMFVAEGGHGYSYDYGEAIQDHAVRPIEFLALDGSVRWREAGQIRTADLAGTDDETLVNALNAALNPDGEWILSVLKRADDELTRHRAEVPDAAGLVVAPGINHARLYALMLQGITHEEPTLVVSEEAGSSDRITAFGKKDATARWIVAVQMVSEGVDIPRLAVGVYASRIRTEMFFRQVVGRFVRMRGAEDETTATLLIPSIEPLLGYAQAIERTVDSALRQEEDKVEREMKDRESAPMMFDLVEPIDSSEAVHHSTILSGETFSDEELRRAQAAAEAVGMPASVTPTLVARLMRITGTARVVGTATLKPDAGSLPNLADQKTTMKRLLKRKVGHLSHLSEKPHSYIHAELNRICGDTSTTATGPTLAKRLTTLDGWIEQAAGS
jgi:superfamily II DNA or RNA helicase